MVRYQKNYPRPQLLREQFTLLDGQWDFAFDPAGVGTQQGWQGGFTKETDILVPFTYETKASGIGDQTPYHTVWYQRAFVVADLQKRTILHFEGSDYRTKVWINGQYQGLHEGGYSRFSFDITNAVVTGENRLVVQVEDSFDTQMPRGKQRWRGENYGCWYVQTTGIWKSVWIEQVQPVHLTALKLTPCLTNQSVCVEGQVAGDGVVTACIAIGFEEQDITKTVVAVHGGQFTATIHLSSPTALWGIYLWSPDNPNLYDVTITLQAADVVTDTVHSYFGMREIRIKEQQVLLNGTPLYQRLLLDQGYWRDSHLTPPSEEALIADLDHVKALGYNGVRKHQKTEDERFFYWCDVKGILAWCEMPSAYQYSDRLVTAVSTEWLSIVKQYYNHPSIITWTPINESWGVPMIETVYHQQQFSEALYHLTKAVDSTRPVVLNDGWEHTISDIITLHDYEADGARFLKRYQALADMLAGKVYPNEKKAPFAKGYGYQGQPIILSEFGGIAYQTTGTEGSWGYGARETDETSFIKRLQSITEAVQKTAAICGYCYTQLTDVQQEVNGLLDEERNYKVDPNIIHAINAREKPPLLEDLTQFPD